MTFDLKFASGFGLTYQVINIRPVIRVETESDEAGEDKRKNRSNQPMSNGSMIYVNNEVDEQKRVLNWDEKRIAPN